MHVDQGRCRCFNAVLISQKFTEVKFPDWAGCRVISAGWAIGDSIFGWLTAAAATVPGGTGELILVLWSERARA
jgi:hypothetical protein